MPQKINQQTFLSSKTTKHASLANTAQMAGFPHHALDTYLPKLVRAGKRVAICDEPNKVAEKVEPAKKATRKSAKKESK